jgi:hypothetical protein
MRGRDWTVLALCLLAPAGAGFVRKLMPGQPSALEIAGVGAVLVAALWLYFHRRRLPGWILVPLLVWGYFQLVYAALAMAQHWMVGALATLTRIVPILMAGIAYAAVRNNEEYRRVAYWLGVLAVALLPVGLMVAVFGNHVLPFFLQPIEALMRLGAAGRSGVPGVAGVFSTHNVLSMSMMAVVYACLAAAALTDAEGRNPSRWWMLATAALALVFLSTRRGAFLAALVGFGVYGIGRHRIPTKLVVAGIVAVAAAILIDQAAALANRWSGVSRAELLLDVLDIGHQIQFRLGLFAFVFFRWLTAEPFGTFLGFAGPEGRALSLRNELFAGYESGVVEFGGAQLLLETGIIGALLMPTIVGILIWQVRRRSEGLRVRPAINLLVTYQLVFFALYYLKELTAMTSVTMAQLFFWAVPGICAALIEREKLERRYWKALIRKQQREAVEESHGAV